MSDKCEISIGKTYVVHNSKKYAFSEIDVYKKDDEQRCSLEIRWKNGTLKVRIEDEEEKEELESCMTDDASFMSFLFSNVMLEATVDGEGPTPESSGQGWKNWDEASAFDQSFEDAREKDPDNFDPAAWLKGQGFVESNSHYVIEDGVIVELLDGNAELPPLNN